MKNYSLLMLGLLCVIGCGVAKATPQAGESAASIAVTYASLQGGSPNVTPDVPTLRCGGDKIITHGDGHTTPCPGCADCVKQSTSRVNELDIRPAVYTRTRQVVDASPAPVAVENEPELPTLASLAPSCADGSCTMPSATVTAGDCASGACGAAASGGPIRNAIKARPVRGLIGKIRERKPVRSLLGRLFRRR